MTSEHGFITLEEHFMTPETIAAHQDVNAIKDWHPGVDLSFVVLPRLTEKLVNVSEERLKDMDAGNVQMQIISHAPVCLPNEPSTQTCNRANEVAFNAIQQNPDRFKAFAWLNMRDQDSAVKELRLRISQGFLGVFLDDHTADGERYDDPAFWPIFQTAEELDVPVYLHPTFAPSPQSEKAQLGSSSKHSGNYPPVVAGMLSSAALSWHSETALHILRLFSSGLFERFPKLKIVLGHDGEGLPFFYDRIVKAVSWFPIGPDGTKQSRSFESIWKENLWFTTSGMFGLSPIACMLQVIHPSKIMYSIDYPFSTTQTGQEFMEKLKSSGLVNEEEWEGIAWKNAKKLLKL